MTGEEKGKEVELTEEQAEAQAQIDFDKGFDSVDGDEDIATTVEDKGKETQSEEETAAAQKAIDDAATEAATPDLDTKIEDRLRKMEGNIGGVMSKLENVLVTAKAAADEAGTTTPTKEQITEAAQSSEKLDALKVDFPEWADATDEQFALIEKRLSDKIPEPVDVDGLKNDIAASTNAAIQASGDELRNVIRIDAAYPDWEEAINTPEFSEYSLEGGPSKERYGEMKALELTAPGKANDMVNDWVREYPQWWADRGSKLFSNNAVDSISLLKGYKEYQSAKTASEEEVAAAAEEKASKDKRLKGAITPAGAGEDHATGLTDEAAFLKGFKSVKSA